MEIKETTKIYKMNKNNKLDLTINQHQKHRKYQETYEEVIEDTSSVC